MTAKIKATNAARNSAALALRDISTSDLYAFAGVVEALGNSSRVLGAILREVQARDGSAPAAPAEPAPPRRGNAANADRADDAQARTIAAGRLLRAYMSPGVWTPRITLTRASGAGYRAAERALARLVAANLIELRAGQYCLTAAGVAADAAAIDAALVATAGFQRVTP